MKRAAILCFSVIAFCNVIALMVFPASSPGQERRHSFSFEELELRHALDSLMVWYNASIVYLDQDVAGGRVTVSGQDVNLQEALQKVLASFSLEWIRTGSQIVLRRRMETARVPRGTIAGLVCDSLTGSGIGDATVVLLDGDRRIRWTAANANGFFSLREIPPGRYTLSVRAVGYSPGTLPVDLAGDATQQYAIDLLPHEITLQEVTVEALRSSVAPAEGYARGLLVRSAPSDRQEYLLDGVRIYNPAHFGETISTFSGEVLHDVEVMQGALPPDYGGQIGGLLNLAMRDGARDRLRGTIGTGTQGLSGSLEGPLGEISSFLVSLRRGYPAPWIPALEANGTPARSGAAEVLAKVSVRLSGSSRLSIGGYWNRDVYANRVQEPGNGLSNTFRWGNGAFHARWWAIASSSTFLTASGSFTRHHLALDHAFDDAATPYASRYSIEDLTLRAHAEQYYDGDHTLRGGIELVRHTMSGTISGFSTLQDVWSFQKDRAWEFSLYLQDQWSVLPDLRVDLGGRLSTFSAGGGNFSAIDPRVSLRLALDDHTTLVGSVGVIRQFVHPYRQSGVFMFYPLTFWYPSTAQAGPTTALQMTLGGTQQLGTLEAGIDAFVRFDSQLHGIPPAMGSGRSYGVGVTLQRRVGNPVGAVRYSLSKAEQSFDALNGGQSLRSPFDRRHELQARVAYEPASGWTIGFLAVLATADPRVSPGVYATESAGAGRANLADVIDLDGSRSPGFQRLQVSLQKGFLLDGTLVRFSLSLMNGYGLLDPFRWALTGSDGTGQPWAAGVDEIPLFPLYPTLSMNIRF